MAAKTKIEINPSLLTSGPAVKPGENVILTQKNIILFREPFLQLLEFQNTIVTPDASGDLQSTSVCVKTEVLEQILDLFSGRDLSGYEHLDNFIKVVREYLSLKRTVKFQVNGIQSNFIALTRKIIGLMDQAYADVVSMESDLIETKVSADIILKPACAEGLDSILNEDYINVVHVNGKIDTNSVLDEVLTKIPTEYGIVNTGQRRRVPQGRAAKILVGGSVSQRSLFEMGIIGEKYGDLMLNSLGTFGVVVGFIPVSTFESVFLSPTEMNNIVGNEPLIMQGWEATATLTGSTMQKTEVISFFKTFLSDAKKRKSLSRANIDEKLFYTIFGAPDASTTGPIAKRILNDAKTTAYEALTTAPTEITDFTVGITPYTDDSLLKDDVFKLVTWKVGTNEMMMTTEQVKGLFSTLKSGWKRFSDFIIEHKDLVTIGVEAACKKFAPQIEAKYGVKPTDITAFLTEGPTGFIKKADWQTIAQGISVNVLPAVGEYLSKGSTSQMFSSVGVHDRYEKYYKKAVKLIGSGSGATTTERKYNLSRVLSYQVNHANVGLNGTGIF